MAKVLVSLPETDLRVIDAAARKAGETRSSFVRRAALAEARRVSRAVDALADLFSIPFEVVPPALVSANTTLRLASLRGLSYYDATYVALAEMLDCPLITADRRLAQRVRETGQVRLLSKD